MESGAVVGRTPSSARVPLDPLLEFLHFVEQYESDGALLSESEGRQNTAHDVME
jgi:hypothetical protein